MGLVLTDFDSSPSAPNAIAWAEGLSLVHFALLLIVLVLQTCPNCQSKVLELIQVFCTLTSLLPRRLISLTVSAGSIVILFTSGTKNLVC